MCKKRGANQRIIIDATGYGAGGKGGAVHDNQYGMDAEVLQYQSPNNAGNGKCGVVKLHF